jgi:hypothetical protein
MVTRDPPNMEKELKTFEIVVGFPTLSLFIG